MPAFIATLGMMGMAKGIALVLSGGVGIPLPRSATEWTESGNVMLAAAFVGIMLAVALAGHIVLSKTALGRHNYAIGGNREAARLSGIDIDSHLITIFTINGLVAGLAGR